MTNPDAATNDDPLRTERRTMAQSITEYSVFIGSRTGLQAERDKLFLALMSFSSSFRRDDCSLSSTNEQTGLEEGRPLAPEIERNLRQSDFAVFLVDDRWSSSDEVGPMSALSQQWALAEELYRTNKLAGIAVVFGKVAADRLAAPDDQLKAVLDFRRRIEAAGSYHVGEWALLASPASAEREALETWLRSLTIDLPRPSFSGLPAKPSSSFRIGAPNADYWIAEAWAHVDGDAADRDTALFCATNAVEAARGDVEEAKANNILAIAQFRLGHADAALATLATMADTLVGAFGGDRREAHATLLANKGLILEALGRGDEAVAVYDDIVSRFGSAYEQPVRDIVAKAQAGKQRAIKPAAVAESPNGTQPGKLDPEFEESMGALLDKLMGPN